MDVSLRLVVFDLDFTLWDAGGVWCDCLCPPFRRQAGRVFDSNGGEVTLYPEVRKAVDCLEAMGLPMALASRTNRPDWARELLSLFKWSNRFQWQEIYPSSKKRHFGELKAQTGFAYSEMLFFDDEGRNIEEVGALGVESVYVQGGFREAHFREGLSRFGL